MVRVTARGTELAVGIAQDYLAAFVDEDGHDVRDAKHDVRDAKLEILGVAELWTTLLTKLSVDQVRRSIVATWCAINTTTGIPRTRTAL
jgi:hypothetical protein